MSDLPKNSPFSDRLDILRSRLYSIVCIEGIDRQSGQEARKIAIDNFLEDMFSDITISQSIVKKNLNQEDLDFINQWITYKISEHILDECSLVSIKDNSVSVRVLAVKMPVPKINGL